MGADYDISGEIILIDSLEARELVNSFVDTADGDIEIITSDDKDGTLTVTISGGFHSSYTTICDFEEEIKNFSPFTSQATKLDTQCDGEVGWIWVGPAEEVEKAKRNELIEDAKAALAALTDDERARILAEYAKPVITGESR